MATAAPFVKLLRQLASAKDDYRTGALDITWDGGQATLFLVFGQPNHAVMEVGERRLEGTEALAALVTQLPPRFELSPWRKEVVRTETLNCTLEALMAPFAQLAGAASPGDPSPSSPGPSPAAEEGSAPEIDFGLADFPLLPLGPSLWADASASVVHLDVLIPSLPDTLIVLTGPKLRAAAVVVRQQLIDAVWVDDEDRMVGESAAMALMGARDGSVSGYRLETPKLAEALTMLWRSRTVYREMPASWVNADSLLDDLQGRRRDCAIVVTGGMRGVALVSGGKLLGVYTEIDRQPVASPDRLSQLLRDPRARVTLRQSPEDRQIDHFPETAYHAFVEDAVGAPATLSEALAALSSSGRNVSTTPALDAAAPALAGVDLDPAGDPDAIPAKPEVSLQELDPTTAELVPSAPELAPVAGEPEPLREPEADPEEAVTKATRPAPFAEQAAPEEVMTPAKLVIPADLMASVPPGAPAEARAPAFELSAPAGDWRSPAPEARQAAPIESAAGVLVDLGGSPGDREWPPLPLADLQEGDDALTAWGQPHGTVPAPEPPSPGPAQFPQFESSPAIDALADAESSADFEGMKRDLIQIGALWLGTDGVAPVVEMLRRTRSSIQDVMATIEAIKHIALPGFEPSVVQAMAREMHYHAAEYLSGL